MLPDMYDLVIRAFVLFTAMPIHEFAHGWVANKLGDPTARYQGRLTLNPFAHLELTGVLMMLLVGFGWAKPVPVNPYNFKRNRKGSMALTALAGPMSNLLMALAAMLVCKISAVALGSFTVMSVAFLVCQINITLMVFNLIPVYPLDGSRILSFFLPETATNWVEEHSQIIYMVFLAVVLFTPLLDIPLTIASRWFLGLLNRLTSIGSLLPMIAFKRGRAMEQLSFKVAQVEGPLDLILQLLSKHKLNIYDIEITKLVDQYMEYIQEMNQQNIEVASEFLEMASHLVYIKSVSLLPKHKELEEKLRSELTGQLIEYALCRQVAQLLQASYQGDDLFFREPLSLPEEKQYNRKHKKQELVAAYLAAVGKNRELPTQKEFEPLIARRVVSVESRIVFIMNRLYRQGEVPFLSLFEDSRDRAEIVATFLAVLDLVKNRRVSIAPEGDRVFRSIPLPEEIEERDREWQKV